MDNQSNSFILKDYLPENALEEIGEMIDKYQVTIRLAKNRKRVNGTYSRPTKHYSHRISINQNLNPYAFLITLLHEFAHLYAWVYDRSFRHNIAWKKHFTTLLLHFIHLKSFPKDVETALFLHINNMKSSDFLDLHLSRTLQTYDKVVLREDEMPLSDLPVNAYFTYNGKMYVNKGIIRKYYLCKDIKTSKKYRFHPLAIVRFVAKGEK